MDPSEISSNRTVTELANIQGGKFALNLFVRVCEDPKLVYFSSPFSCPDILQKLLVKTIRAITPGKYSKGQVLFKPHEVGNARFCAMLEDTQFTKFTFLRDPIDRFCNAYTQILSDEAPESSQREKIFNFLGLSPFSELSLNKFAEIVSSSFVARDLIPEFRPQRSIIAYDFVEFNFFGNISHWQNDLQRLFSQKLGIPSDHLTDLHDGDNIGVSEFFNNYEVDNATQVLLERSYTSDYEMLEELGL